MDIIKKTWDDITISDYKRIVEINNRELDSDMEKEIAVLAVLCGVQESEIYNLPITELSFLLNKISWIRQPFTFNHNFNTKKIRIDGVEYVVEPDIDKFTVSQYMDFQNFWEKRNDNMGNLLSVFIIPEGHKYNEGYDVLGLAQKLEDTLSIRFWNEVCFFFLENWLNSIKASIVSSAYMVKKEIRKTKNKEVKKMLKEKQKELMQQLKQILPIG